MLQIRHCRHRAARRRACCSPKVGADAAARPQRPERHVQHRRAAPAYVPDYEGSDDYELIPVVGIRGRVSGFNFYTRGTYLYVDFIRRGDGALEFDFGPIVGARLNRTGKVEDDVGRCASRARYGDRSRRRSPASPIMA